MREILIRVDVEKSDCQRQSMVDTAFHRGTQRRKASLSGGESDAQLTGVRSRCGTQCRYLSGCTPLGADRVRTERLWLGIAILVSESDPVQQPREVSVHNEPEQAILRARPT